MSANKRSADDDGLSTRSVRRKSSTALHFSSGMRSIAVGEHDEQQTFDVHVKLLIKHSAHFKALIEAESLPDVKAESQETEKAIKQEDDCEPTVPIKSELQLPDHEPESFGPFSSLIYTGHICSGQEGDYDEESRSDAEWSRLADAWVLGCCIESTSFMDAIADALVAKLQGGRYPRQLFTYLIDASPDGSPIRQLQADIVAYKWSPAAYQEEFQEVDDLDFLRTLAKALGCLQLLTKAEIETHFDRCGCRYHSHLQSEEACYKTMF
ncbi:hypothetical protein LTR95_005025 [Oleoguttula sp. CCFEE 5521]